jgi:hypothetical protein
MPHDFVNGSPHPDAIRHEVDCVCPECGKFRVVNLMLPPGEEPPLSVRVTCPICASRAA